MNDKTKALYEKIQKFHLEVFAELDAAHKNNSENDMQELADQALAAREMNKLLDSMAKKAKELQSVRERVCVLIWMKDSDGSNIKTPYCNAAPNIKTMASIPHHRRDPEKFTEMMEFLGVPKELHSDGVVRPHWPAFVDYISTLAEEGKPFPPGIDPNKTYPVYSLTLRKKGDIIRDEN